MSCAAAPAPHRNRTSAALTETFSRLTLDGNSRESGWQRILYETRNVTFSRIGPSVVCDGFLAEAVAGLSQPQKTLPCKFLYDEKGSRLFNEICELEEYYPTRTENQILRDNINEIAGLIGSGVAWWNLAAAPAPRPAICWLIFRNFRLRPHRYLRPAAFRIGRTVGRRSFPTLEINPLEADYSASDTPGYEAKTETDRAFFPGSTIGNFEPLAAIAFLRNIAQLCGSDRRSAHRR